MNSQRPRVTAVTGVNCSQRPPTGQVRLCWRPTTSVWMQARLGEPVRRRNALSRHTVNVHSVNRALVKGSVCPERSHDVHTS